MSQVLCFAFGFFLFFFTANGTEWQYPLLFMWHLWAIVKESLHWYSPKCATAAILTTSLCPNELKASTHKWHNQSVLNCQGECSRGSRKFLCRLKTCALLASIYTRNSRSNVSRLKWAGFKNPDCVFHLGCPVSTCFLSNAAWWLWTTHLFASLHNALQQSLYFGFISYFLTTFFVRTEYTSWLGQS